jgi:hypothetical protein
MDSPLIQHIAAALFVAALLHTFAAKLFHILAHRHPRHAGLFELLGEVEVVFGFWAMVLVVTMALLTGAKEAATTMITNTNSGSVYWRDSA